MIDAKRWPCVEVCDPSTKRGMYLIWAVFSPDDRVFVVRAKHVPDGSFDAMSDGIKSERTHLPRQPALAIMDQRGGQFVSNRDLEKTFFDEFHERGLHYEPSVDTPMQKLHDWLRPVWRPDIERAVPKLMLTETVANMADGPMTALGRFIWDPTQTKAWQYKQKSKDWVDCLRYLAGYPGLTYQRLQGRTDMETPGIAASYTESSRRQALVGDVERRLLNRGLIPNISETYSHSRRRGSAF
jgi:hypothetical protein